MAESRREGLPAKGTPVNALEEALLIVSLGIFTGLVANACREDRIVLRHDYFHYYKGRSSLPVTDLVKRIEEHELRTVGLDELRAALSSGAIGTGALVLVDARGDEDFQIGHIPGAIQFDHYRPDKHIDHVLRTCLTAETVVIYCKGGSCDDSLLAARDLIEFGLSQSRLAVFAGGIDAWQARGFALEAGKGSF